MRVLNWEQMTNHRQDLENLKSLLLSWSRWQSESQETNKVDNEGICHKIWLNILLNFLSSPTLLRLAFSQLLFIHPVLFLRYKVVILFIS